MRKAIIVFVVFLFCCIPVFAETNNIFGIHLAVPNKEDLRAAAELVNSSGGKWG
ncbi:hypothetical protein HYS00_00045, partial [Candidatus Microgenomates bacterium]|nr:hypothetical protein [Candidatus Microgenomates bacterium]